MVNFPAPVGGLPLASDLAPSILFAVLYALLLPLTVYRIFDRRSRTVLLIGTEIFAIERVVFFSLRALQSHNNGSRLSLGLTSYAQSTLGMGFIGIASDLVNLLRCLLVNPTYGSEMYFQSSSAATKGCLVGPPPPSTSDLPDARKGFRGTTGLLSLAFLASSVPGIIANTNYNSVVNSQKDADSTAKNRYISTAIVPALAAITLLFVFWGYRSLQRVCRLGAHIIITITLLMSIVAIYRLSVMHDRIDTLTAPGNPLDKSSAKAIFYILHILPEWIATLILLGYNTRKVFGTGPWGDWRRTDETDKQRKKRLAKEAKKARKQQGSTVSAQESDHDISEDGHMLQAMKAAGNQNGGNSSATV